MKKIVFPFIIIVFLFSCKKEQGARVEIYLLKSFTYLHDTVTYPYVTSITNTIIEDTPLIAHEEIQFYSRSTATFTLHKDISTLIQKFGSDKAFTVTVDKKPIYYGVFHPAFLSSLVIGISTIDPILVDHSKLPINYISITGNTFIEELDKRNNTSLIDALKASKKFRQ